MGKVWDWFRGRLDDTHEAIKDVRESETVSKAEKALNSAGEAFTEKTSEAYDAVADKIEEVASKVKMPRKTRKTLNEPKDRK